MLFVGLALLSIFLYIRGYKISALTVFFFFITTGFNLVPDELVALKAPLTKNSDYAFFILLGFFTISSIFTRDFFKVDTFALYLIAFFSFLFICILYNRFSLGIGWGEITRTVRYYFFWLAYFVFRSMSKEQLLDLFKIFFIVTVASSVLFLLQLVVNQNILVEVNTSKSVVFGREFTRFYNQPSMLHFFIFMGIYYNPFKGKWKIMTTTILILAFLGAFHRSHIGIFIVCLIIGFVLKLPKLKQIQIVAIGSFFIIFIALFAGNRFSHSRTFIDLKKVASGNVLDADIDVRDLKDATFTFRIAHFLERNEHILQKTSSVLFGGALLTEDSKMLDRFFDFKVGLIEELTGQIVQVDTADITYSLLVLRFGYLGSILFLILYLYLTVYFFKNKDNVFGHLSFLYMILSWGISFFSTNLVTPITYLLPIMSYLIIRKTNKLSADT